MQTATTSLARRVESINLDNSATVFNEHPVQDVQKRAMAEIRDLTTPELLHGLNVQVFHRHQAVCVGQLMGKLEMKLLALVSDLTMQPGNIKPGPFPVVAALYFGTEFFTEPLDLPGSSMQVQRRVFFCSIGSGEEGFQTEIKADAFTRSGLCWLNYLIGNDVQPILTKIVPSDSQGFYVPLDATGLKKLVTLTHDADLVSVMELVPSLFQSEGSILFDLLETRWSGFNPALQIPKEELVGPVNTFSNILNRLGAQLIPETETLCFFETGDMEFDLVCADAFAEQSVISPMQGNQMIVDTTGDIDLVAKMFVPFGMIEFKGIGSHSDYLNIYSD